MRIRFITRCKQASIREQPCQVLAVWSRVYLETLLAHAFIAETGWHQSSLTSPLTLLIERLNTHGRTESASKQVKPSSPCQYMKVTYWCSDICVLHLDS